MNQHVQVIALLRTGASLWDVSRLFGLPVAEIKRHWNHTTPEEGDIETPAADENLIGLCPAMA